MDLGILKNALVEKNKLQVLIKNEYRKLLTPYEIQVKNAINIQNIKEIQDKLYNYLKRNDIETDSPYIFMFDDYCKRMADNILN